MPSSAASRRTPWTTILKELGRDTRILTSGSVISSCSYVTKSFFKTPSNKAPLVVRLIQEVALGFDLSFRVWYNRKICDLCIITSPPFFMACICAFTAKLIGTPYVFDIRDRYPRVLADLGYLNDSGFLYRFLAFVESFSYKKAQLMSTVTNGLLREFQNEFSNLNFVLVRNGFDEGIFTNKISNSKKRINFTVVYHGRMGRFYDAQIYLEIMNLVHESDTSIQFLMIGDLPHSIKSNSPQNLEVLPAMKLKDLSKVLETCHVGICLLRELPAMKMAFPSKAYDYIGAGLPILAGPSGELADFINKWKMGVTFSDINPKNIANAIVQLKSNYEDWLGMCVNLQKVRNNFGRRKIAKEFFTEELFKD